MKESYFYLAAYNIDMISLQTEIENVLHKKFSDDPIPLDCLNKVISGLKSNEKLGLDLLPERKKQSYVDDLKRKLSSTIRGNQDVRSRDKFTKREIKALWARHLMDLLVPFINSEFDILVALKVDFFFLLFREILFSKKNNPGLCYCAAD